MPNRRLTTGLFGLLIGFLAACQPAEQRQVRQPAVDTAEVRVTLDSLRSAFIDAYEAGDAERIAAMWAENGIQSVAGEPPIRGRDSIRAAYARFFEKAEGIPEITIDSVLDVRVLGDEWAYTYATLSARPTPAGADSARETSSTYLLISRRTPDGWKAYREVAAPNGPPEPTQ